MNTNDLSQQINELKNRNDALEKRINELEDGIDGSIEVDWGEEIKKLQDRIVYMEKQKEKESPRLKPDINAIKEFQHSISNKDLDKMKQLLDHFPSLITCRVYMFTPLSLAAYCGFTEGVKLLIDLGLKIDNFINQQGSDRKTALHCALSTRNEEIAKMLLMNGANVNDADSNGDTPLIIACRNNASNDIIELLVSYGADVNAKNNSGETPLRCTVQHENFEVIRILEYAGANESEEDKDFALEYGIDLDF